MAVLNGLQVTARDDSGQICSHATRQLPTGMLAADGPPTTLSPTGVDRVAFLQGNLTRDATYFVNGSPVGARDIFVVRLLCHFLSKCLGPLPFPKLSTSTWPVAFEQV